MVDGEKIARMMRAQNITSARMAEIVGVTPAMMTYITQGKREPNVKCLVAIANTLGCKVDDLLS